MLIPEVTRANCLDISNDHQSSRHLPWARGLCAILIALLAAPCGLGQIFSYECDALPSESGWTLANTYCEPQSWLDGGWYYQHVELCPGDAPPGGQSETFTRSLEEFDGARDFFVEWVVRNDAPYSDLFPWAGGAGMTISGNGGVSYQVRMVRDGASLIRDNLLPFVFPNFESWRPHTHRLELYDSLRYAWFIDGQLVDAGIPEGQFPSSNPRIFWRTYAAWGPSTSRWDYIRYGRITQRFGDLDCDGNVNNLDVDAFVLALSDPDGYAAAHPACHRSNADYNRDGLVDNFDIDAFVACLNNGGCG